MRWDLPDSRRELKRMMSDFNCCGEDTVTSELPYSRCIPRPASAMQSHGAEGISAMGGSKQGWITEKWMTIERFGIYLEKLHYSFDMTLRPVSVWMQACRATRENRS